MSNNISAQEAYKAIQNGAILVDVRESNEVADIWVDMPNVLKIPYSTISTRWQELPDNPIILCCAVGLASEKAAIFLQEKGLQNVSVIENGLIAWKLLNYPMKTAEQARCKCCGGHINEE